MDFLYKVVLRLDFYFHFIIRFNFIIIIVILSFCYHFYIFIIIIHIKLVFIIINLFSDLLSLFKFYPILSFILKYLFQYNFSL